MLAVLCSGPCFDLNMFSEDAEVYKLLDLLLASEDPNIYNEGQTAVVMLLEVTCCIFFNVTFILFVNLRTDISSM